MKYTNIIRTILLTPVILIYTAVAFIGVSELTTSKASAITCADGSTLPDAEAANCPTASGSKCYETDRTTRRTCPGAGSITSGGPLGAGCYAIANASPAFTATSFTCPATTAPRCFESNRTTSRTCPSAGSITSGGPLEAGLCYAIASASPGFSAQSFTCPTTTTTGGGSAGGGSSSGGGGTPTESTAERCANAQPGSVEADGCTFFDAQFAEAVNTEGKYQCGKGSRAIKVGFNFGCRGESADGDMNPIVDILLAIFRFLSTGVGIVVIASVVVAGIQYTMSRGNPQSTAAAITRVTNAVVALLIYIFSFAIANFIVPGGMFL